jgi:hypothetical protein
MISFLVDDNFSFVTVLFLDAAVIVHPIALLRKVHMSQRFVCARTDMLQIMKNCMNGVELVFVSSLRFFKCSLTLGFCEIFCGIA